MRWRGLKQTRTNNQLNLKVNRIKRILINVKITLGSWYHATVGGWGARLQAGLSLPPAPRAREWERASMRDC